MSVVLLGSTSGSVTLQEPAIAGSTVIDLPATSGTMAVLPTATSVLPEASGGTGTTTGYYGFKNRIINGAMVIDQRNAGASVTPANNQYLVDRWFYIASQASKATAQQNAGAVTPPAGFKNYLGITSSSAYSVGAAETFNVSQSIEGFNTSDLEWGTANAQAVTLSFRVYSSLTGTFGGSIANSAVSYSYPFSYSIPAANTWTTITVTIAGPTAGTWIGATNGIGLRVLFGLGVGSTLSGTAGAWAATGYYSATGATSVVGTNGATFYITGVQLEKGSTATSFDYRPYGTELNLCMRYYQTNLPSTSYANTTIGARLVVVGALSMRATPTVGLLNGTNALEDFGVATRNISSLSSSSLSSGTSTGGLVDAVVSTTTAAKAIALIGNVISLSSEL